MAVLLGQVTPRRSSRKLDWTEAKGLGHRWRPRTSESIILILIYMYIYMLKVKKCGVWLSRSDVSCPYTTLVLRMNDYKSCSYLVYYQFLKV